MPKQSRGFWVCSLCSEAFDRFEEASHHESQDCPRRYPAVVDSQSWKQQASTLPLVMPPLSNLHAATPRDASFETFPYTTKLETRCYPLLGPNDQSTLSEIDSLACRTIQLFEVNDPADTRGSGGQVGLRCSYCFSQASHVFPKSTHHVADCVRQLAEEHLTTCYSFPESARIILKRDKKKRQQRRSDGDTVRREDDDSNESLHAFCSSRCRQVGVIDRVPQNTGIYFVDKRLHGFSQEPAEVPLSNITHMSPPATRRPSPVGENFFRQNETFADRSQTAPLSLGSSPYDPRMQYHDSEFMMMHQRPLHAFDPNSEQLPSIPDARSIPPTSYHPYAPTFSLPPDYPFIQERGGEWVCKFCSNIHPQMRDPKYYWIAPDRSPPPADFIDYHLGICRVFQQNQFHALDYREHPQHHVPGSVQATMPMYDAPGRWGDQFEEGQQQFVLSSDPSYIDQPYTSLHMENSNFDASSFIRPPPVPNPHGYILDTQHRQRAETPSLPLSQLSPMESNAEYDRAIDFLTQNDKNSSGSHEDGIQEPAMLVLAEDKLLLTDYFYFIMKQLRPVRFSEADRRTRGGKRENIAVGYGGLQCVHCSEQQNTRKFFWSNVDRLANSFAEIPSHVLKCRRCPQPTKDALLMLKQRHPEQMARLPRGSQKVFFRRMWRRLHDEDPPAEEERLSPILSELSRSHTTSEVTVTNTEALNPLETGGLFMDHSPAGTSSSEESAFIIQRSTEEAAKALAVATTQTGPPSPSSRVLLALPDDQKWLSDTDCFIRRQLEVFCATLEEVENARSDRKYPVIEGQVGIRCIHCAISRGGARGQAVAYPFNIGGIYEAAREFQRLHLETCENLPTSAKAKLEKLKGSSSLSSVLRKYYIIAANALGLTDTRDGIRAGGDSVPIGSQAAFAFSDESSPKYSDEVRQVKQDSPPIGSETKPRPESRKRDAEQLSETPDLKRPAFR